MSELQLHWDQSHFYIEQKPTYLRIFDTLCFEKANTAWVSLPCDPLSLLDWKDVLAKAKIYAEQGYYIFWHLDFGWEQGFGTHNLLQNNSRMFAVQYFIKTVWPQYACYTVGACFYQGCLVEDKSLREICDYITYLTQEWIDTVPVSLFLDATMVISPKELMQRVHKPYLANFLMGIRSSIMPLSCLAWGQGSSTVGFLGDCFLPARTPETLGVLFSEHKELDVVIKKLSGISFRMLLPETAPFQWDGLDTLLLCSDVMTETTQRVLEGFQAAGGNIVVVGDSLGIGDVGLEEFLKEIRGRGI